MVTDSTNDWSVSMATPACLRQHIIGSTPVITTTDEETDIEGSLTSVIKQTKTLKSTDKVQAMPYCDMCINEISFCIECCEDTLQRPVSCIRWPPLHQYTDVT